MSITIALSKGRIYEETLPLLAAAGITVAEDPEKSRKLIFPTNQPDVRVVLVRASDVPVYVQTAGRIWGCRAWIRSSNTAAKACTSRWTCRLPNAASAWRCVPTLITKQRCSKVAG